MTGNRYDGRSYSPEYTAWNNLKARDIEVSGRWGCFENFFEDMGNRPEGTCLIHDDPSCPIGPDNAHWGLPTRKNWKRVEPLLADALTERGEIPGLQLEYRFHPVRRWRLDIAIPELKIGIEIDGHTFHSSAKSQINDAEKSNALGMMGWRTMRYPASAIFNHKRRERIVAQIWRLITGVGPCEDDLTVLTGD